MVGHVKLHGHGEDQRERDHAEVSHLKKKKNGYQQTETRTTGPYRLIQVPAPHIARDRANATNKAVRLPSRALM
eukprot:scaffold21051_cov111-Isochrysis_galbana.AAC.1